VVACGQPALQSRRAQLHPFIRLGNGQPHGGESQLLRLLFQGCGQGGG
jgi:hypothetical protein